MSIFTTRSRIIVTCKKRIAPYLEQEVRDLGFEIERRFVTGVELKGTVNDCIRLNLNLRCASQVLYSLKEFTANSPEEVYNKLLHYPWETILSPEGYFSVTNNSNHFTVNSEMFVNVKVKDAIVDRMRREVLKRPDSGSILDGAVINLYWNDQQAEVFLDTSGETLAKHGYRKIPGQAPMLEALAVATIMATKWDRKSPFVNPMCGSSTVAIEAVLLATNRRPGLFRENYSFMHVLGYDATVYQAELQKLKEQVIDVPGLKVIASDISQDAIEISKVNAELAGVDQFMEFKVRDFESTPIPQPPGVIYFNPEYGERLGEVNELEATYARMGDFLKKQCQGYLGYIFTGNLDLAKKIGLKASRRIEFYTAQIDCRLLEYEMYGGSRRVEKKKED
ncbi:MAG: class I SAM-dependent RNA methyltransferase [Cytophagales bacterium]|jgi:23S rRNA G2445 N2-methylase RlmL|nr:class I SAM-dependent RNA methyltransferase [Cytophagales bacterium]MCA6386445.1 class I SAM-dependent RNA methyltransferase [Cytophagales bacterium]MCA6390045.1 class I SAM-dependent RNA methyltransferase [Cytophagales bacterium]MCA6393837.1 class I SAM-dependent RNA methyltransferase [Cytophagales bacterium]MCA6397306.1 class I SAM-dependent RNA methyltransferase [Cytophagales bacterium]